LARLRNDFTAILADVHIIPAIAARRRRELNGF